MSKKIYLVLIFVLFSFQNCFSQDYLAESKELGLVSYLTTVKSISEYKLISLASNDQYKIQKDKAFEFRAQYNLIRLSVDRLINQLSADMTQKNRLKHYKVLDKFIKGEIKDVPTKYEAYKTLLAELDTLSETFLLKTYSSIAGASLEEITGALELAHTLITDTRDFREKKIQSIIQIVKMTRLESVKNLTEKTSKE